MKTFIGTEAALTVDLTAEEFGAYERLRRYYWQHQGLPEDDRRLMRITGVDPDRWEEVRCAICGLFEESWRLPALDALRADAAEKRERKVAAGKKGAAGRWGNGNTNGNRNGYANGSANADAKSENMAEAMPVPMDNQWPSASASDEVRYEERLAPTRTHARDFEGDIPFDPPQSREEARRFLEKKGLGGRFMDSTIARLMDGKLFPSQLEHLVLQ